ncbi:MAG: hypothetical protein K0V04_37540 [Deltaproteobacteria bacterium]|nr:hypothetical protein [Deltaproteobacteria bacterium]
MLKLAASNPDPSSSGDGGPRILAPGAPPSPGPIPNDLARHLTFGEALVWWGDKDHIRFGPVILVVLAAVSILGFVSVLAPEFWLQSWKDLAKPIAALLSPAAFVLLRERFNQRAVLVTDASIVEVGPNGHVSRLRFSAIVSVRRDVLRGGLLIDGQRGRVRVPPSLIDDAGQAVASQRKHGVQVSSAVEDPTGWLR